MSPSSVASPACHFIPKWPQGTMPVGSFVQLLFTSFSRADCHALTHVDGCSTRTNWNIPSGKYVWLPVLTLHPLDRIVWVIYNARPTSNWFNIQRPRRCCKKETSFRIEASQSLFQTCHSQPLDSGIVSPRCSFKFYRKTSNSIVGSFSKCVQLLLATSCYSRLRSDISIVVGAWQGDHVRRFWQQPAHAHSPNRNHSKLYRKPSTSRLQQHCTSATSFRLHSGPDSANDPPGWFHRKQVHSTEDSTWRKRKISILTTHAMCFWQRCFLLHLHLHLHHRHRQQKHKPNGKMTKIKTTNWGQETKLEGY